MSLYRNVHVSIWSDRKFRALDDDGKLLFLYLLTSPETTSVPGCIGAGRAAISEGLEWESDRLMEAFAQLEARGMAAADWRARFIWLPNALKHIVPASWQHVKGWIKYIHILPECDLKDRAVGAIWRYVQTRSAEAQDILRDALGAAYLEHCGTAFDGLSTGGHDAPPDTPPQRPPNTPSDTHPNTPSDGVRDAARDTPSNAPSHTPADAGSGSGSGSGSEIPPLPPPSAGGVAGNEKAGGGAKRRLRRGKGGKPSEIGARVLARLNELGSKAFEFSPQLEARIQEGVPEADLIAVVESQWRRDFMRQNPEYFRPKTLFGPDNFREYLAEAKAGPAVPRRQHSSMAGSSPQPQPAAPELPPEGTRSGGLCPGCASSVGYVVRGGVQVWDRHECAEASWRRVWGVVLEGDDGAKGGAQEVAHATG